MDALVWVDGWQMQCCGDPFEVGGAVTWTVVPPDRGFLDPMMGQPTGVTHAEEHHANDDGDLEQIQGTVRAIKAVFCRYGPHPSENCLSPVAGSGVAEARHAADGWEPEAGDLQFVGYLVELA